jgi:hypothetical protein
MHGTDDDRTDDTFSISAGGISGLLLPISSNGNVTQYNTADQSFMKVEGSDATYSFTAWTKDGTKYEFKETIDTNTNNGCAATNNVTWRWSLSTVTDIHGNTISYTYYTQSKSGCANEIAVYPATITYGNGKYSIVFDREARTDYQTSWGGNASRTLYGTLRLNQVRILNNGSLVKRYDLSYAPNNATNIYPSFSFTAGGKTLTLAGVQEFGADGSALPAATFTYADNMHLTTANNGQGGAVSMTYAVWQYLDDVNKDIRSLQTTFGVNDCVDVDGDGIRDKSWIYVSGALRCDGSWGYLQLGNANISASVTEKAVPEQMLKLGGKYQFKIDAYAMVQPAVVGWGMSNAMLSGTVTTATTSGLTGALTLPIASNPATTKLRLTCDNCFFRSLEYLSYSTYYRVTARTVTIQPENSTSTYTYQYDNAAPATVDNSAAVATGGANSAGTP